MFTLQPLISNEINESSILFKPHINFFSHKYTALNKLYTEKIIYTHISEIRTTKLNACKTLIPITIVIPVKIPIKK